MSTNCILCTSPCSKVPLNDAPALTAADVGISVVSATDLYIEVSDILLIKSSLSAPSPNLVTLTK